MGVEYFVVCDECKEYIDLHKAYQFSAICGKETPPVGYSDSSNASDNDPKEWGYYWNARGLWFVWKHRGHKGITLENDCGNFYDKKPYLKEVFPYEDDEKLRQARSNERKWDHGDANEVTVQSGAKQDE